MKSACAAILALLLAGCASTVPSDAWYQPDRIDAVIADLTRQEALHPRDAQIKRDLGIALQQAGYPQRGLAKLRTAAELGAADPLTYYFYARCADLIEAYDEALVNYALYMEHTGRRDGVVLARMHEMAEAKARRELSRAVRVEANINADALSPGTVAVPRYANLAGDEDLAPLSRGLALILITDLARVEALTVVEREKLNVLQDEMELGGKPVTSPVEAWAPIGTTVGQKQRLSFLRSPRGLPYYGGPMDDTRSPEFNEAVVAFQADYGLAADGVAGPQTQRVLQEAVTDTEAGNGPSEIDADSVVRIGKLLAAGTVVLGSYATTGTERVQLQANLARLDGSLVGTSPYEGPTSSVLSLQKRLTFDILSALGVEVDRDLRRAIEALPTRDFRAFLAYCRGLEWDARGMPAEATAAFQEALERDPEFTLAQEALDMSQAGAQETRRYALRLLDETLAPRAEALGQLYRTGGWVGLGPGVVLDRDDDEDSGESSHQKIEPARVVVEGELPGDAP